MKPTLVVTSVLVAATLAAPAEAQRFQGRLVIGRDVYAVTGEIGREMGNRIRLSLETSRSKAVPEHSLVVLLGERDTQAVIDGQPEPLDPTVAQAWEAQVRGGFKPGVPLDGYRCTSSGIERVCDSPGPVALTKYLTGRLRLIYKGDRLTGVRFFSLAEWDNPFFAYVSLSLHIH